MFFLGILEPFTCQTSTLPLSYTLQHIHPTQTNTQVFKETKPCFNITNHFLNQKTNSHKYSFHGVHIQLYSLIKSIKRGVKRPLPRNSSNLRAFSIKWPGGFLEHTLKFPSLYRIPTFFFCSFWIWHLPILEDTSTETITLLSPLQLYFPPHNAFTVILRSCWPARLTGKLQNLHLSRAWSQCQ